MIFRNAEIKIKELIQYFPCVAIVGPRQVGKTTLVKQITGEDGSDYIYIDLENPTDYNRLNDSFSLFNQFPDNSFVIDEVQRRKELFPILRSVIDANKKPGRFILLGSASPDLIRDSSESLAGRIAYSELMPLNILEIVNEFSIDKLWINGGFPVAFTETVPQNIWMENFIRTYIERDLIQLGFPGNTVNARRLWQMLAHIHGNILNYSELSRSIELDVKTVINYIQFLESAFLIHILQPYFINIKKRLVKSPKVYLRDSGVLHYFLGIENKKELIGHPKMGASWEGFVIEQIKANLKTNRYIYFYRTHDGAELDLIIERGGVPVAGIEIKYGSNFTPSRGNTEAIQTLNTKDNFIIVRENEDFIHKNFRVCGIEIFLKKYLPKI
ncbi:MAG: ATP-binding protein [Draconibacterium sp.]